MNSITIDLKNDIPPDIGVTVNGNGTFFKRWYGVDDIPPLMDYIAERIKEKRIELDVQPEEIIKWDIIIFGNIHPGLFGIISILISGWDDLENFIYIKPVDAPIRIFPIKFE